MKTHIKVNDDLINEAFKWANAVDFTHYSSPNRKRVDSKTDTLNYLYSAKVIECAFAQYLKVAPDFDVRTVGGDNGVDLRLALADGSEVTVDIKGANSPKAQYLIWPLTKCLSQCADVLMFGTGHTPDHEYFGDVTLHGWITRFQFTKAASCAKENDPMVTFKPGTRYLHCGQLTPMRFLNIA